MNLNTLLRAVPVVLLSTMIGTVIAEPKKKTEAIPTPAASVAVSPSPTLAASSAPMAKKWIVSPESKAKRRLTLLKKQISLTPDQEAKAKPIINKYVADRDAAKGNPTKLIALKTQYDLDINRILTLDQQKDLSASKAASLAKLKASRVMKAAASSAASPVASQLKPTN